MVCCTWLHRCRLTCQVLTKPQEASKEYTKISTCSGTVTLESRLCQLWSSTPYFPLSNSLFSGYWAWFCVELTKDAAVASSHLKKPARRHCLLTRTSTAEMSSKSTTSILKCSSSPGVPSSLPQVCLSYFRSHFSAWSYCTSRIEYSLLTGIDAHQFTTKRWMKQRLECLA